MRFPHRSPSPPLPTPNQASAGLAPLAVALVAIGGVSGTLLRWAAESSVTEDARSAVVLAVNIVGSALLGWLIGRGSPHRAAHWWWTGAGFCGGLTTFSSFALDVAARLDQQISAAPLLVVIATTTGTIVAAGVGYRVGAA